MARMTKELEAYTKARAEADAANARLRDAAMDLAARLEADHAPGPRRRSVRRPRKPRQEEKKRGRPAKLAAAS